MRRIQTAETRWQAAADRVFRGDPPPAHLLPLLLTGRDPILPTGHTRTPVVDVRVNHGVWQTQCPFCPSAQHASETSRLFYCAVCMNHDIGHQTVPVKWPRNADAIEAELARRPFPHQRHWEPGETLRDLKQQREEAVRDRIHHA